MYALASSGVGWAPSHTQRLAHNITHTTSLTTTSRTQHLSHNIPHTTSRIQHHSHNISHNNISHTTSLTQRLQHARCLPRGRMYALASSGVSWAPAQISWQALHFAACQGVGCTPWRRLASAGHRRRFRGRRSTLLLAKGSDVRPGVVWRRLGTGADFVAGAALCCLHAKGSDVRPGVVWRRLGTGADFVAGAALCCLPRGRMYALASSGVGWAPAQISWQAQHFAACHGVGCTPWRRLASAGHRRRFRGRCSTLLLAKGSGVRPGVVWRRLGTGADFVAGAALCCLPKGRMYALASSGVGWAPAQISWQAQHFVNLHVQISCQARSICGAGS